MKKKMMMSIAFVAIAVLGMAQFPVKGTWINTTKYTSGADAGLFRIANKLVIASDALDIDELKMVDPFTVVGTNVGGTLRIEQEGGVYVNNMQAPADLWQSVPGRHLVEFGSYRLADSTGRDGRKWGRRVHCLLALYKNYGDSSKLMVAERRYISRFTADNKMPKVQGVYDLNALYVDGQLIDSLVFTGATGTNTGSNVKAITLPRTQSISFTPSPKQQKAINNLVGRLKKEDEAPAEGAGLNVNGNTTQYELIIHSVETLQTDNENCEAAEYKNKAEYLGVLNAGAWGAGNMQRFNAGTFMNYPGNNTGSPKPLVLAKGQPHTITANLSKVFSIGKNEFKVSTLRITGYLSEINFPCDKNGNEMGYEADELQTSGGQTSVLLKDLKQGFNYLDIKKIVNSKLLTFRIHFEITEKN
jgi:predicted nucleic-acid-binding Zn-ribbon protein